MLYISGERLCQSPFILQNHAKIAIFSEWPAMVAEIYISIHILPVCCYGAQNEAYMCRSAENMVRGLGLNELEAMG